MGGPCSTENRWPLGIKGFRMETVDRQTKRRTSTSKMDGWPSYGREFTEDASCFQMIQLGLWKRHITSNGGPTADIMMKLKMMMVVHIFMSTLLQLTKTTTRTHQNPISWGRKETVHQENNGPLYTRVIVLVTTVRNAMESKNVSISGCERVDFEGVVILPDQLGLKQPLMSRSIVQTLIPIKSTYRIVTAFTAISFPPPKF